MNTQQSAQPAGTPNQDEGTGVMLTKRSVLGISVALLGGLLAAAFTAGMFASNLQAGQERQTEAMAKLIGAVDLMRADLAGIDRRVLQVEASRFTASDGAEIQGEIIRLQDHLSGALADVAGLEARIVAHKEEFAAYRLEVGRLLAEKMRSNEGSDR